MFTDVRGYVWAMVQEAACMGIVGVILGEPVPPFLWHEGFYTVLGAKLGYLVHISPRTLEHRDIRETWLKFDAMHGKVISNVIEVEMVYGVFQLGIRVF